MARHEETLASALYEAHRHLAAPRGPVEGTRTWPRWFALRHDLREPYLEAARVLEAAEAAISERDDG